MPKTTEKNKKLSISKTAELRVLRKVVDLSSSDLDLDRILSEIVKIVTDITKADSIFVYLFDEKKKNLILMASKTPHKKELGKINLKAGEGITGWVAKQNKPVAIEKGAIKDKRFKNFDVLPEDCYEAFLSVPTIYKGKVSGVINVQYKSPHRFAASTVNFLSTIAKQVGGVIEHARLYETTSLKAMQFDSLVKVSQSITSQDYLEEILNLIVIVTAEMLNSKICSIMLLDDKKGDELIIAATQSLSQEYKKKPNLKVKNSLLGNVIKDKRPVLISDVREEDRYFYRDLAKKEHLTSLLAVPMIVKQKAIGVLTIYTKERYEFDEEEVSVLQMVANQAAVAVENTKLVEEAFKSKEALETRKVVDRAKGILMRLNGLSEEAAYRMIHKKAMDSCRPMKDIAESVLLMDEFKK